MSERLDGKLEDKLRSLEGRFRELARELADPGVVGDRERYTRTTRAYSELEPVVEKFRSYNKVVKELEEAEDLVRSAADPEMREMASEESRSLVSSLDRLKEDLRILLLPRDPLDEKNVILEIRAGTGGDEATLFAEEMFRVYCRFAETMKWKVETTDLSKSEVGGIKEVVAVFEGDRVYSRLKFESGVHRVQRVPATETQGRIHTSAVTVAVLPEADEVTVEIDEKDLRVDTFCSSGPGGQSVNTTQSAVRIIHLPSNIVVQCQDEKSWHKNKARAMQVLRSRLYDKMLREQHESIAAERRGLIGSGDRSEKIRTYNFPQSRVTDHRIGLTMHNLPSIMKGGIGELIEALVAHDQAVRLQQSAD
jgi:peptide chain release factor 1